MSGFAKILVMRLTPDICNILHPHQYGVPGAPPISLILFQIRDFIQYQQHINSSSHVLFSSDFSRAFDSLSLAYLYGTLNKMGFPEGFIRLLQALFATRSVTLKINGRHLPSFHMARDLSQGCPLSSILFSLALTPLMYRLQTILTGITIHKRPLTVISYIDDLTYILGTPDEAHQVIDLLTTFSGVSQITLNKSKSKILCFDNLSTGSYHSTCHTVDHLKILGITWYPTINQTRIQW